MITETTAHLGLQLPHPSNELDDDVLRLRSAINSIDAKFAALDALLNSDDISLDTLQELVSAIKGDAANLLSHIGAGGVVHQSATQSLAGFMSAADKQALDGHIGAGDAAHLVATDAAAGFMSASDKAKLNEVTLGLLFDTVAITPTSNGQTDFTVTGGYTVGAIQVFLNGVKLAADDFTASTSPGLTLSTGANTADTIEVVRFKRALSA